MADYGVNAGGRQLRHFRFNGLLIETSPAPTENGIDGQTY
jgi:hypothetical protein